VTRRRGWILVVLGLILAISAGAMVYVVLQNQRAEAQEQAAQLAQEQAAPVPTMRLPVAARPLEPGTVLSTQDYVLKEYPLDLVPVTAISDTAGLDSKILVQPVGQGETFRGSEFLGGSGAAISQQLKQGEVLFAFPIVDLLSQSNLIQDGDHIDLLLTIQQKGLNGEDLGKATAITLQNIEIFKVLRPQASQDEQQPRATALLFSMKPEDAVMVKFVKDSGGTIDFTLRSPQDQDTFQAPPINDAELLQRYYSK
jgi:pilus assembly protein CpaB